MNSTAILITDSVNNRIKILDLTTGMVNLVAGSHIGFKNGPAFSAQFNTPNGIALDSSNGNIYVADSGNNVIRLINTGTGMVSTIAGVYGAGGYLDGPSSSAEFSYPYGIALDSSNGNIYVADSSNNVIRLINATTGMVSTFAGNGTLGYSNGPALQAEFNNPYFVTIDPSNGNIIVSDTYNNRIALSKTILSF